MMGEQARDRVRSHFATETMCRALDELYAELLGLPVAPAEPDVTADVSMGLVRRTA